MKNLAQCLRKHLSFSASLLVSIVSITLLSAAPAGISAQAGSKSSSPATRIAAEISGSERTPLHGSQHPLAQARFESGRVAAGTKLQGISMYFSRTQSQEADLQKLLAAQQNPGSPQYHQWLTPEQFASRFGMADADIAKVQSWLEQQGFSVDSVARGKDMIRFSGTVSQVEAAFATELHHYTITTAKGIETHFAPSTELSVPSAMAGVVFAIRNLDDFRPKSHIVVNKNRAIHARPNFTGSDGSLFFAPGDVATEYDIQSAYGQGYTGAGQTIVIVGQSAILNSDIEAFETASGLPVKDPTPILVPNSGTSQIFNDGDETESDLDLEWSGAIAKGANISFVYTGSEVNNGAFDAITYAVDNSIGTIISSSYGDCEADLGTFNLESILSRAASQGQTVLSASGDDGATDCYGITDLTSAQQQTNAVDYPASSEYVTGVGGTEISQANSAYLTPGKGYWEAVGSNDIVTSVLQYIPEQSWNEDSANCGVSDCLAAGGGGASALYSKPSWQTALTPADGKRDVPDVSLNAAINNPGYLFCSSDQTDWSQGQEASCNSGFRDAFSGAPTWAGGTSFATPIFAGMVAIINQQQGYTTGQGLINPTLYTLAASSATAFHDIKIGNNSCPKGTGLCSSAVTGFTAETGYDQVSGLGTVDLANLANAWPASTGPVLIGTTTAVSASSTAPAVGANDTFTITVASDTGTTIPAGTVTITVDSGTPITGNTLTSNGTFTYTTSFTTAGSHVILASYSGDATHATSTGSVSVNVAGTSSGTGTFTLKATNITVTQGSAGSSTITVTPAGGYTGTVQFSVSTTNSDLANDSCPVYNNAVVTGTAAVTTTLTIDTNGANCLATGAARKGKGKLIHIAGIGGGLSGSAGPIEVGAIFAGLMLAGWLGRYSRRLRILAGIILLATMGMAFTGCGGGSNSTTVPNAPKGTYTLTLTGADASSATIPQTTTTFTLTVQ